MLATLPLTGHVTKLSRKTFSGLRLPRIRSRDRRAWSWVSGLGKMESPQLCHGAWVGLRAQGYPIRLGYSVSGSRSDILAFPLFTLATRASTLNTMLNYRNCLEFSFVVFIPLLPLPITTLLLLCLACYHAKCQDGSLKKKKK